MKQKQKIGYVYRKVGSAQVVNKVRAGRFQITEMKVNFVKTAANESQRDFVPEIDLPPRVRVCIQYSRYNKREQNFDNQQIWLNYPTELEQLQEALKAFLNKASEEEASFSSSIRGE